MTNDEFRATLPDYGRDYFDLLLKAERDDQPVMLFASKRADPNASCHVYAKVCEYLGVPYCWVGEDGMVDALQNMAREAGFEVTDEGLGEFVGDN
ncbi:hypothetical protein [Sorangium sp. So ce1024]|uniref:hypothetical protein n=1 Tax=Sorangium sp. So ce1024 TaxID=3133327 RepID=UPI003F029728